MCCACASLLLSFDRKSFRIFISPFVNDEDVHGLRSTCKVTRSWLPSQERYNLANVTSTLRDYWQWLLQSSAPYYEMERIQGLLGSDSDDESEELYKARSDRDFITGTACRCAVKLACKVGNLDTLKWVSEVEEDEQSMYIWKFRRGCITT